MTSRATVEWRLLRLFGGRTDQRLAIPLVINCMRICRCRLNGIGNDRTSSFWFSPIERLLSPLFFQLASAMMVVLPTKHRGGPGCRRELARFERIRLTEKWRCPRATVTKGGLEGKDH